MFQGLVLPIAILFTVKSKGISNTNYLTFTVKRFSSNQFLILMVRQRTLAHLTHKILNTEFFDFVMPFYPRLMTKKPSYKSIVGVISIKNFTTSNRVGVNNMPPANHQNQAIKSQYYPHLHPTSQS